MSNTKKDKDQNKELSKKDSKAYAISLAVILFSMLLMESYVLQHETHPSIND